jgi:hypothetical protein
MKIKIKYENNKMKSEDMLRLEVMKTLIKNFGLVDAGRFIDIIKVPITLIH